MATIRKRNGKWQVQVRHLGHNGVSKTFLRKQEAEQWARELKAYLMDKESVELILRNISGNTWHDRYEKIEVEDVHYYEFEN